jgi:hypothetical protein
MDSKNFQNLLDAASKTKGLPPLKQAEKFKSFAKILVSHLPGVKGSMRKLYEHAHNLCDSMADGLKNGEATSADVAQSLKELASLQEKAKIIESAPVKEKAVGPDSNSQEWLDNQLQRSREVLQKYKPYESQIPRTLNKKFLATRSPVVAITHPILLREKLSSFKLLDNEIFGYPVLKSQVVLGLNSDWIVSDYKRNVDEAVNDILDILKSQTGKRYNVLGEPKARGLVYWVWLVTDQDMQKLNKSTGPGHFRLTGWSFPFEADKEIKSPPKLSQQGETLLKIFQGN